MVIDEHLPLGIIANTAAIMGITLGKEHRQMLIDAFINAIFLYDDKMLITFNYKEGTKTVTFDDVKKEVPNGTSGSDLDCRGAPWRVFLQHLKGC